MISWLEEVLQQERVGDRDYAEYLRLETRRRKLEQEAAECKRRQSAIAGKIIALWGDKTSHRFGNATFYKKKNVIVLPLYGVTPAQEIEALIEAGYESLCPRVVDGKTLRDEVRRIGSIPADLLDTYKMFVKNDLYVRVGQQAHAFNVLMADSTTSLPVLP
jgi:hypothetical protein